MASFNQDFIIFNEDTLLLRYTFTDLSENFDSGYGLYWAAWTYNDWKKGAGIRTGSNNNVSSPEPDHEKHNAWLASPAPTSDTGDISVVSGDVIVNVFFNQGDFAEGTAGSLSRDTNYYTELVISENKSENNSVVAATGLFYVSSSIFTTAGYRP